MLLKMWIHEIGRKYLPLNSSTRICSYHFVNAAGCLLRPDKYSSVNIPILSTTVGQAKHRKPPASRIMAVESTAANETTTEESDAVILQVVDVGVQASDDSQATIVRFPKQYLVWMSNFMLLDFVWKTFQKMMIRYLFTLVLQTTLV